MATVKVAKGRNVIEIDEGKVGEASALGYEPVTSDEVKRIKDVEYAATALGGAQGIGEGALRGVSLGFSDAALRAAGVDAGGLAARAEGDASKIAEIGGAVAPALLSGGSSAVGSAARLTLAGRAAQVGRAITGATEAAAGRGLVARAGGAALASGFEGALAGAGQAASELALGDRDLAAEHLLAGARRSAGLGALFGAGATTLGIGLERAYTGSQRVSRGLLERAVGAGDAAPGQAAPDGLAQALLRKQVEFLRGTPDDLAAGERALGRTRTEAGRRLAELAEAKPNEVAQAVGQRMRAAAADATTDAAVKAWKSRLPKGNASMKSLGLRAEAGFDAAAPWKATKEAMAFRRAVRQANVQVSEGGIDAYRIHRQKVADALEGMRAVGDDAYAATSAAVRDFLESGDDVNLWGRAAGSQADAIEAAQAQEAAALAKLKPTARNAIRGMTTTARGKPLDEAKLISGLGKADQAAVDEVIAARRAIADALDAAGEDVTALRRGIDALETAGPKYRKEIAAAGDDLKRLAALRARDATGKFLNPAEALLPAEAQAAIKGLKSFAKGTGLVSQALRGLSLGGTALADIVGKVGTAVGKPAAAVRVIARARGGIDAVRAKRGEAVAAFGRLADGVGDVARGTVKAARRVPPAVSRQQQRDRQRETLDTLSRVVRMASDPKEVAKEMGPALLPLREAAPNVAGAVMAGAARAAAYLAAVAPPTYKPTGAGDVTMVDPFALEAWRRKADAVMEPTVALLDLAGGGTLTKDEARAIATVYPKMWAEFQRDIMKQVGQRARDGQPLSFKARNALGVIGGVAADDSLRPADFASIQASMSVKPPHPPAPPPRSQIKPTAPSLPKWQRIEEQA